jgi:branched-chain amino acid transport system permease protein
MALSLNLEYGVAGVPNFGKALFVSIGAYTAGVMMVRVLPLLAGSEVINACGETLGQALQLRSTILKTMPGVAFANFGLTLLVAAIVGGLLGWLFSWPALRLKQEWYLALVLLVGAETVRIFVRSYEPIICGTNGLSGIGQPFAWIADPRLKQMLFAALCLTLALFTYAYCQRLTRSPFGRLLKGVRENELAAVSLGKNVVRVRGQVMIIGSALAAVAGVLFVMNSGFASTNDYSVALTLDIWVMIVLGGLGNHRGALLGAAIVTLIDRFTGIAAIQLDRLGSDFEFNYVRAILFGLIVLVMLRYRSQGLLPEPLRTTMAHKMIHEMTPGESAAD